jgi:hypothetical protein
LTSPKVCGIFVVADMKSARQRIVKIAIIQPEYLAGAIFVFLEVRHV